MRRQAEADMHEAHEANDDVVATPETTWSAPVVQTLPLTAGPSASSTKAPRTEPKPAPASSR